MLPSMHFHPSLVLAFESFIHPRFFSTKRKFLRGSIDEELIGSTWGLDSMLVAAWRHSTLGWFKFRLSEFWLPFFLDEIECVVKLKHQKLTGGWNSFLGTLSMLIVFKESDLERVLRFVFQHLEKCFLVTLRSALKGKIKSKGTISSDEKDNHWEIKN